MKTPDATSPQTEPQAVTLDVSMHGRDEMNLAEFPITVLADRAPKGAKTLIFRASHGQLTITGSDAFGLPTALDADVIVALIQLTKLRTDFKNPKVHFTRYELLRLLGWNNEGRSYHRLHESLQRWVGVTLHYDNCWWDNRAKRYGDATLHILESAIILDGKGQSDEEGSQQLLPLSSFTWNRVFLNSCQADNLKLLDVGMYFSLEHSAAKRLYRFLDKRFYKSPHWVFDLAEIAFERVGLSRNYARNAAKIKEKLQPAVKELQDIGFLEPLARDERYFKDTAGWKIRLSKRQGDMASPAPLAGDCSAPELVGQLIERGVTAAKARELFSHYSEARLREKIDIFDWLARNADRRIHKNPGGWLRKAIEDDYTAPKGFESATARQERERQREEDHRRQVEIGRANRDQQRRAEQERVAADAYLAGLTPSARAALEAEALAWAPEDARQSVQHANPPQLRAVILRDILRDYLVQKLKEKQPLLFE
jgi:hypothetical protein